MSAEEEDPRLTAQTESILERLRRLEIQVSRLVDSQTVEAKEFVVFDERDDPHEPPVHRGRMSGSTS